MSAPQKNPLRVLTVGEQQQLERIAKASSERLDVVRRAQALLALTQGHTFTEAGKQAGISRQAVAQLVERFHQRGMAAALSIAPGRGRKPTYEKPGAGFHSAYRPASPRSARRWNSHLVLENAGTDPAPRTGLA